jgi:hypothetical protein
MNLVRCELADICSDKTRPPECGEGIHCGSHRPHRLSNQGPGRGPICTLRPHKCRGHGKIRCVLTKQEVMQQ